MDVTASTATVFYASGWRRLRTARAVISVALSAASIARAQPPIARHGMVRVNVTADSGSAVGGATVIVTLSSSRQSQTTKTAVDRSFADAITDDAWEFTWVSVQRHRQAILTPDQLLMLPAIARQLFNAKDRVHIRISPR